MTLPVMASLTYQSYAIILLSPPCLYALWKFLRPSSKSNGRLKVTSESDDPLESDPSLLRKHSHFDVVKVPATDFTYPAIRIFHCPHPQALKLPKLPLLVFIHGLGGSVAQWHPLLTSLVNLAPCLAIDLPGCGLSKFAPRQWDAYTTSSLLKFVEVVIDRYLEEEQEIVFVCHSMGCSLGALLTSKTSPIDFKFRSRVKGLIAICPPAKLMPDEQVTTIKRALSIAVDPIFNLWRAWDRRGGTESGSVARFVGKDAEDQLKRLQVRFNNQSKTPVFRRMTYGCLPIVGPAASKAHLRTGALLGKDTWAGVQVPVLIVAGKDDPITSANEAILIASYLGHSGHPEDHHSGELLRYTGTSQITTSEEANPSNRAPSKLVILPSPASHALLYSPLTVRPVSSLVQNFLHKYVTEQLSLGWQLQYLTTEGKWDVKNLAKWQAVNPVSTPIAGVFRAMKTLREVDGDHTPAQFVKDWSEHSDTGVGKDGRGPVVAVVDISHDSPIYNPEGLEDGGITYRKFPTVSKLPPTRDEVRHFIDLIDRLRSELSLSVPDAAGDVEQQAPRLIAVHCHYGFNRTGYFVISYLVERLGWPVKEAIEEFKLQRAPGVRHSHFVDELWAMYWDWADDREAT